MKINTYSILFLTLACSTAFCEELDPSLCARDENELFNCSTQKGKTISLCESKSNEIDFIEYRFGAPRKIDFSYKVQEGSKNTFSQGKFSGGSRSTDLIWFKNGAYTYILFSPDTGTDGVAIAKNETPVASQMCVKKSLGDIGETRKLFHRTSEDDSIRILGMTSQ